MPREGTPHSEPGFPTSISNQESATHRPTNQYDGGNSLNEVSYSHGTRWLCQFSILLAILLCRAASCIPPWTQRRTHTHIINISILEFKADIKQAFAPSQSPIVSEWGTLGIEEELLFVWKEFLELADTNTYVSNGQVVVIVQATGRKWYLETQPHFNELQTYWDCLCS